MLKKPISYTNFDGVTVTENFYFNLTKAELVEMEISSTGGMRENLQRIIDSQDPKEIIGTFKEIIGKAYGERTEDGKFRKSKELSDAFLSSEAYSELFMSLLSGDNDASEFINGLIPKNLDEPASKEQSAKIREASENAMQGYLQKQEKAPMQDIDLAPSTPPKRVQQADVASMSREELEQYIQRQGLVEGFQKGMDLS